MSLPNLFKKVSKPAWRVNKEFIKVLQELDFVSLKAADVKKTVNGKTSESDLIESAKKNTGVHILIFYKNLALSFDLNVILGVENPKWHFLVKSTWK